MSISNERQWSLNAQGNHNDLTSLVEFRNDLVALKK